MERDRYLQERQAFAGPAEFEAVVILLERDRHNFRAGSPICLRGIRKRDCSLSKKRRKERGAKRIGSKLKKELKNTFILFA